MTLSEVVEHVGEFHKLSSHDKILVFAWYLHTQAGMDAFAQADLRKCFQDLHLAPPNLSVHLPSMSKRRPPELIKVRHGYKIEGTARRALDSRYGSSPQIVIVTKLLSDLPGKVPDVAERAFLSEALDCYRVRAYRAAILMTWNLTFDHLLRWILGDAARLSIFNAAIPKRFPKRSQLSVTVLDDFEELKESEILDVCGTASLFSQNILQVLREKLRRRNIAAHPSRVAVTQHQADDVITDLVNNVVLGLA